GGILWDRTLSELKLEYMDLDEFLSENGVAGRGPALSPRHNPFRQAPGVMADTSQPQLQEAAIQEEADLAAANAEGACYSMQSLAEHFRGDDSGRRPAEALTGRRPSSPSTAAVVPIDCGFTKTDLALATIPGQDDFDPSHHPFSEDELKPQPIVKKSRKQFVPNELKDDKYWARRQKNNIAAKRSREVRRVKENQIVLRASYLEKENIALREEVHKLQQENDMLRKRLHEYEP
ncbi:unnamed protein product, partial [Ixodes persulcatus]